MPRLLLATSNPGKIDELRALLAGLPHEFTSPAELGLQLEVAETGEDYTANAGLKATAYARAAGCWALADDSGLEVVALNGAPGLRSARLAGPGATDGERRQVLLAQLEPHARPWRARFRAVVALASPQGALETAEGACPGEIIPEARGSGGFGYDPIFLVDGTGRTMAELTMAEKNRLSHRARAIEAIRTILLDRLDG